MVSGSQLAFGFGQVEGTAVGFRISGNEVDDEGYQCRDMSLEDEPAVSLSFYYFGELHGSHQHYHCQYAQSAGQLVADNLRTASHGSNQREFIVGTPACQQDTHYADTRCSQQEEHSYIEVQYLQSLVDGQAGKCQERSDDYHERCQIVEEPVREFQINDFLCQHLDDVAGHLEQSPFPHAHRTEAALEEGAYLTLHVNQDDGKHGIHQDDAYANHHAFEEYCQTFRHQGSQHLVYPVGYYTKVKHVVHLLFTIYYLQFTRRFLIYNSQCTIYNLAAL